MCRSQGAAVVIRQPTGKSEVLIGGWGLKSYTDGKTSFTLASPGTLVFTHGDQPLFYNGSDKPVVVTFTQPTGQTLTLAPQAWSDASGQPSGSPPLFDPLNPEKKGN